MVWCLSSTHREELKMGFPGLKCFSPEFSMIHYFLYNDRWIMYSLYCLKTLYCKPHSRQLLTFTF